MSNNLRIALSKILLKTVSMWLYNSIFMAAVNKDETQTQNSALQQNLQFVTIRSPHDVQVCTHNYFLFAE